MSVRNAASASSEQSLATRYVSGALVGLGGWAMFRVVRGVCRRGGLDIEKADRYGLQDIKPQAPMIPA